MLYLPCSPFFILFFYSFCFFNKFSNSFTSLISCRSSSFILNFLNLIFLLIVSLLRSWFPPVSLFLLYSCHWLWKFFFLSVPRHFCFTLRSSYSFHCSVPLKDFISILLAFLKETVSKSSFNNFWLFVFRFSHCVITCFFLLVLYTFFSLLILFFIPRSMNLFLYWFHRFCLLPVYFLSALSSSSSIYPILLWGVLVILLLT